MKDHATRCSSLRVAGLVIDLDADTESSEASSPFEVRSNTLRVMRTNVVEQDMINKQITRSLVAAKMPFRSVESVQFQNLLKMLLR